MQAVVKACLSGELDMNMGCVLSSDPNSPGNQKALKLRVPLEIIDRERDLSDEMLSKLQKHGVTVVMQNGWLKITPEEVIDEFDGKIFNQHPGPLPETKGLYGRQPHAVMIYLRDKIGIDSTEVVVQRVHKEVDKGEIVGLSKVQIFPDDTAESLQTRAKEEERHLQIEVLKKLAKGMLVDMKQEYHYIKPGQEEILSEARKKKQLYPRG